MKKYTLLFLLAFQFCNTGKAQAVLGISQYDYTLGQDTVAENSYDSLMVWVVNRSAVDFNDTLSIFTSVQDSSALPFHIVDYRSEGVRSIPAFDSIPFAISPFYNVSPAQYHYDINVIVIWPAAISAVISDSLKFTKYVLHSSGISEIDLSQLITAYPNPIVDNLSIENNSKTAIEEVRIVDSSGRLVSVIRNQSAIETKTWETGIYTLDILLKNKQRRTIRIVKQK